MDFLAPWRARDPRICVDLAKQHAFTDDPLTRKTCAVERSIAEHPVMRETHEAVRRLHERQDRVSPPTPEKSKRGAPVKLTPAEIVAGVAIVRREQVRHHEKYPARKFKQTAVVATLRREMTRDGKPIEISPATWLRLVVRPALG